jgi:hypothetical protein
VNVVAGWLTFEEYAKRVNVSREDIEQQAITGSLGKVETHPKTHKEVILWPPELRRKPASKWPKVGTYQVRVDFGVLAEAEIEVDVEDRQNFARNQKHLLKLVNEVGDAVELTKQAESMLFTSAFLHLWISFETFLKDTIHEMLRRHPEKLARTSSGRRASVSYEDIVKYTNGLTSASALREEMIRREIERSEAGDMSVSGMINYLKSEFEFSQSPYDTWYQWKGRRQEASYQDITDIKEIRNCLMHDGGRLSAELRSRYPGLNIQDGYAYIDGEYLSKSRLILLSVAHEISESIETNNYKVR